MDQTRRSNDGLSNNSLFPDSQQYNAFDNLFPSGNDPSLNDASWGVNASGYPFLSRGPSQPTPSWQQNANHLGASTARQDNSTTQGPYGHSPVHSPVPFAQQGSCSDYRDQHNYQYHQPQYDPSLVNPAASTHSLGFKYPRLDTAANNTGTVALQALEREARPPIQENDRYDGVGYSFAASEQTRPNKGPSVPLVNQNALARAIPAGNEAGEFTIINYDQLVRATDSERMGNYIVVGKVSHEWPVNRAALPRYDARKSRSDLRRLAGNDVRLLAKIGKKSAKKIKRLSAAPRPMRPVAVPASASAPSGIKYEEVSSSEDESSDDDDSSYTSEEAVTEPSPLPSKRPDNPKDAVEFDTIKALWRSRRRMVDSQDLRNALGAFWDIVKTTRDRWKIDANAVSDAEEKKRLGELPLLKSRVKDQRDMIEAAFKAALKWGHRSIIELLAENVPLIFLCYQFLLDRFKAEDHNGPLARVILEIMSLFTTLTEAKIAQTHLAKVLPRYVKKGDAKTSFFAKKIIANATAATSKEINQALTTTKPVIATKVEVVASPSTKRGEPEPVAGVKRSASNAGTGSAQKKIATGAAKVNGTKPPDAVKKATVATSKPTGPTSTASGTKPKVVAKPSGFFSSLQSASKKPGTTIASKPGQSTASAASTKPAEKKLATSASATAAPKSTFSFSETMANLMKPKEELPTAEQKKDEVVTTETAEEKAKRLRKEARRQMHVSFKKPEYLVEVRYFTHDSDEEVGHDSSQTRDISDVGGEGRMLKQHRDQMDLDEDDEEEEKFVEFRTPSEIDFSDVDKEERKRNYFPYGGGELQAESAERPIREQYEADTLIVFYADESDVPPNPREPMEPYNGEEGTAVKAIGAPPEKYAVRARQMKTGSPPQWQPQPQQQAQNMPNISSFAPLMGKQQPQASTAPDLAKLLANLQQAGIVPQQPQPSQAPPAPSMFGQNGPFAQPDMQSSQTPTLPNGQPDISAILASLNPSHGQAPQTTFAGMPNMAAMAPQMQQQQSWENSQRAQMRETAQEVEEKRKTIPFYKTRVCKYWQDGKCRWGDNCSFLHE